MQLNNEQQMELGNVITTFQELTQLFEEADVNEQYQQERKKIEESFLKRVKKINAFISKNTSVKDLQASDIEEAFEVCLKKAIVEEGIQVFLKTGKSDLKSLMTEEVFNKHFETASLEAYIMLLRNLRCMEHSYATVINAERALMQEFN